MLDDATLIDPEAKAAAEDERPLESSAKSLWSDIGHAARLIGVYGKSDPVIGAVLLAIVVFSSAVGTYLFLQFQVGLAAITNALVAKDASVIPNLIGMVVWLGVLMALLGVLTVYASLTLRMRFRTRITRRLVAQWMDDNRFFHVERRAKLDHPEQRIQEDVYLFAEVFMFVGPGILSAVFSIFLYIGQLWTLSPPLVLTGIGMDHAIPGFLVYLAIVMGVGLTLVTHFFGSSLTRAEVVRQRLEAQFRQEMAAIRLNAESIAFARGEPLERRRLAATFDLIRKNWNFYTWSNMKIVFVMGLPEMLMSVGPPLLLAPFVINGQLQIGDVALIQVSFGQVYLGIGVIIIYYSRLALMRSSVARMRLFENVLSFDLKSDIAVSEDAGGDISVRGLKIAYPDGQLMNDVGDLTIAPGDRVLVQGKSGAGKSTLLRSIAGLWPFGGGRVSLPKDAKIAFLPQRGYMPDGTLASLMSYPLTSDAHADAVYTDLLEHLGLGRLAARLHDYEPWSRILSPGEQQRIAAARAILAAPDFLFVDEATSALDAASEENLYGLLAARLPNTALISVAHRQTVERYHDATIKLESGKTARTALVHADTSAGA